MVRVFGIWGHENRPCRFASFCSPEALAEVSSDAFQVEREQTLAEADSGDTQCKNFRERRPLDPMDGGA